MRSACFWARRRLLLNLLQIAFHPVVFDHCQAKDQSGQRGAQLVRGYREELVAHSHGSLGLLMAFALAQVGDDDTNRGAFFQVDRI